MLRLGIKLIVACLMSSRTISKALDMTLTAAGLDEKVPVEVPGKTFFADIRDMLEPMNRDFVVEFCKKSTILTLGVDESPRKVKKSSVMSVALTNEDGDFCLVKIAEHNQRSEDAKSTLDTQLVLSILESELGTIYEPTNKKICAILTDSCKNATATREKIAAKLDDISPLEFDRIALPCVPHAANISEEDLIKQVSPTGRLEILSRKVGAVISSPRGVPMDNIFGFWQALVPEKQFLYSHGKRFRHRLQNIILAFIKFDELRQVVNQTKSISVGAAAIAEILEDQSIYFEMAICGSLLPLLDFFWSDLSSCQTGIELTSQIKTLAAVVENIESGQGDLDEYLCQLDHSEDAAIARSIIQKKFIQVNDFNQKVKTGFLKITKKLLRSLEPYLATEHQEYVTTPHNITVER